MNFNNPSRRLIWYGFETQKFKEAYPDWKKLEKPAKNKILDDLEAKGTIDQYAEHDEAELYKDQIVKLNYPKPLKRYSIIYETPHQSVEPIYYFALHLMEDMSFGWIEKIADLFSASEHSSFYGAASQRLGLAQDKVSQYLAQIGQFIRKDLFQLVRDIRWIDERLKFHEDARKGIESAEMTLKGLWTDIVDGVVQGQRVSANIFTMAQQLQFTSLPDWFFSINPTRVEEVDKAVDKVPTTVVVKNVLKRKLNDYLVWRQYNYEELKQRRRFELSYLSQHYNIVRMYVQWVKPYLRHIERLRSDQTRLASPELVGAFETSMVEIEILGMNVPQGNEKTYACMLMSFEYRTRPSMQFSQEGFQHRGPLHMGETKITWRAYAWTKEQIEWFKKMKEAEDLALLSDIDNSIKAAMDAIGDDLQKYLQEAEAGKSAEEPKKSPPRESVLAPFADVLKGFGDILPFSMPKDIFGSAKKKAQADAEKKKAEEGAAGGYAQALLYAHYKVFKKAHRLLAW